MEKKEMRKEWLQDSARNDGESYFNNVIYSLKSTIKEVERNRNHWREAIDNGKYPSGEPLGNDLKVNHVVWNANHVQQLNLYHEQATRVTARLARAYKVDV